MSPNETAQSVGWFIVLMMCVVTWVCLNGIKKEKADEKVKRTTR